MHNGSIKRNPKDLSQGSDIDQTCQFGLPERRGIRHSAFHGDRRIFPSSNLEEMPNLSHF